MSTDPRETEKVRSFYETIKDLEPEELLKKLHKENDDDLIGWTKYHFMGSSKLDKPWQIIVINRWLERDKFFRNILPQWLGTGLGLLSFVVAVFALIVALNPPKP